MKKESKFQKLLMMSIFLLIAIGFVYEFSYSTSLRYPYYYGGDSAQFLTIGKAWSLGKIPYIEMFDHKGPFIFWINMLGFLISNGQKYGVAVLQVVFFNFTILAFYCISQNFYKSRIYGIIVVLVTLLAMKNNYIDGNTVEEYCLPFISWSTYGIIRYWKQKNDEMHDIRWAFLYGVTFGICFLTRITNVLPICMGIFFIFLQLLNKRQYRNLLLNIVAGLCGLSICILPFLIYFWQKNALYDCIYGTLLYNFEYAAGRKSWILSANLDAIRRFMIDYFISFCAFISAFICMIKKEYKWSAIYFSTGLLEQAMYLNGDAFVQYPLVCITQIPILFNEIVSLCNKNDPVSNLSKMIFSFIFMCVLSVNLSEMYNAIDMRNAYKNAEKRTWESLIDEIPQDQRNRFVAYGGNEFKELYLLKDLMPCYKYFVIQEWQGSLSSETKTAIYDAFATREAQWILTDEIVDNIQDILLESYLEIDHVENYHLYKLVN